MQLHLIPHPAQIQVVRPDHLIVLKRFTGGLQRPEALAHQAGGSTLFPFQDLLERQSSAPLPLFGEITELFGAIDPKHPALVIHEVPALALPDPNHGMTSHCLLRC
jgi:hypothetical protein